MTHSHLDHVGAIEPLKQVYPELKVIVHETEAPYLIGGEEYSCYDYLPGGLSPGFKLLMWIRLLPPFYQYQASNCSLQLQSNRGWQWWCDKPAPGWISGCCSSKCSVLTSLQGLPGASSLSSMRTQSGSRCSRLWCALPLCIFKPLSPGTAGCRCPRSGRSSSRESRGT